MGSSRCHDLQEEECIVPQLGSGASKTVFGSGYYTTNDYKDMLRYANDRHIGLSMAVFEYVLRNKNDLLNVTQKSPKRLVFIFNLILCKIMLSVTKKSTLTLFDIQSLLSLYKLTFNLVFNIWRDVTVLNWNNICEWGNGESAYKLANAGYNVRFKYFLMIFIIKNYDDRYALNIKSSIKNNWN